MKFSVSALLVMLLCYGSFSHAHSLGAVGDCASNYGYREISSDPMDGYNLVELEGEDPDSDLYRVEDCVESRLQDVEYENALANLEERDKVSFAELVSKVDLSATESASLEAIKAKASKAADEKVSQRLMDYQFDKGSGLIVDGEEKVHFRLVEHEHEPLSREVVCSSLKKDSTDYNWCMGIKRLSTTPPVACKNSYGDPCGSKYKRVDSQKYVLIK